MNAADFLIALFGLIGIAAVATSLLESPRARVMATCKRFPERRSR